MRRNLVSVCQHSKLTGFVTHPKGSRNIGAWPVWSPVDLTSNAHSCENPYSLSRHSDPFCFPLSGTMYPLIYSGSNNIINNIINSSGFICTRRSRWKRWGLGVKQYNRNNGSQTDMGNRICHLKSETTTKRPIAIECVPDTMGFRERERNGLMAPGHLTYVSEHPMKKIQLWGQRLGWGAHTINES